MRHNVTFETGGPSAHLEIEYANQNVLCAGSPGRIEKIAGFLEPGYELIRSRRGLVTVHGTYKGKQITAFSTGMAPGSVSITLPEVIEACDADDMIIYRLGTAGGLHPDTSVGDFVISTEIDQHETTNDKIIGSGYIPSLTRREFRALLAGAEGLIQGDYSPELVSKLNSIIGHAKSLLGPDYVPRADPESIQALTEAAKEFNPDSRIHIGKTMVTDELYFFNAFLKSRYGGKDNKLRKEEIPDVYAVSMEFSTICALRDRYNQDQGRNIVAGNLLVVADTPLTDEERVSQEDFGEMIERVEREQIKIGLESLVRQRNQMS